MNSSKNIVIFFCVSFYCPIICNENVENISPNDPSMSVLERSPSPLSKRFNKMDNEFCDIWQILNDYNQTIEKQKRDIENQAKLITLLVKKSEIQHKQIKALLEKVKQFETHTHEYYLSHMHGGVGPKMQTTKPKTVREMLAIAKPLQISTEKTSKPVVKPE